MIKQLMGDGQWCPVDLVVYIFIDMLVSRRWASWQFVASHFCAPKLETRIYKRPYQNQDIFISSFHTWCKLVGLREEVFIWRTLVVDIPYSKVKPDNYCQLQNWKGQPWKGKRASSRWEVSSYLLMQIGKAHGEANACTGSYPGMQIHLCSF